MTLGNSLCAICAHNHFTSVVSGVTTDENGTITFEQQIPGVPEGMETGTCDAFPNGIPLEIYVGGFDHRQPYADETVLFKQSPNTNDDQVETIVSLGEILRNDGT